MRIVALVDGYPPLLLGGAETMMHRLLLMLAARSHDVSVCSTMAAMPYALDGVDVSADRARLETADVVFSHLGQIKNACKLNKPVVELVHNHHHADRRGADLLVYNTDWLREKVGLPGLVVHPPVDPALHRVEEPTPRYVTLVNRLPIKGVDLFYRLARLMPDVEFLAVTGGYGSQVAPPTDLDNVTVWPVQEDMRHVWEQTAVLCLPSQYDTYAMVTVEAACSSIPVLVNDLPDNGGVREALGAHGVYVPPNPLAWERAIRSALADLPSARAKVHGAERRWDHEAEVDALDTAIRKLKRPRLISALVVRNEADRYLREVLEQCLQISDKVVVWDDGSTDGSGQIAADLGCEVWRTPEPMWHRNESVVRESLYAKVVAHRPEWVYCPDADEVLEHPEDVAALLDGQGPYMLDMWQCWGARDRFRVDGYWKTYHPVRLYRPPAKSAFLQMRVHCGSAPACVVTSPNRVESGLRMFHLGYLDPADVLRKIERYRIMDPQAQHDSKAHYDSYLAPPTLIDIDGHPVFAEVPDA